ncbi:site-specific recombinase XerD [Mycobacteroides abscessus subsp. abscessus]|nr:site-specific recombinase XerD [Mycobacteroides abscessus subsp. abscessus]
MSTRRADGEGTKPYKRKDGRWQITANTTATTTGRPVRKSFTGKTAAEARAKHRAWKKNLDNGLLENPEKTTLATWINHWLDTIAKNEVSDRSWRDYKQQLGRWVLTQPVAGQELHKVTALHIERVLQNMREAGRSESTVLKVYRVLSKCLKDAVHRDLIPRNPIERIKPPRPAAFEPTVMTPAQAKALISTLRFNDQWGPSFTVALALGLRQGERLGLCWDDVNLDEGLLYVRRSLALVPGGGFTMKSPKTASGVRTIALPAELIRVFRHQRVLQAKWRLEQGPAWVGAYDVEGKSWDLVFTTQQGKQIMPAYDRKHWKQITGEMGLDMRVHDARHTAATTLLALGVNPRVTMQMMGWSSATMLNRYQHVLEEMERDVAVQVNAALFG